MTSPGQQTALVRGSLVTVAADGTRTAIPFQYNPDTVRRTLQPNTVGGQPGDRSEVLRFVGAPADTITLECRLAADASDPQAAQFGVAPQLAALTLLAYPRTADVLAVQAQLDAGTVEVTGILADRLLFVFGDKRVVPCRVTEVSVVEQLHDARLTPVMAVVTLGLRALSYSDVDAGTPTWTDFVTYQTQLEQLAPLARRQVA